MTDTNGYVVIKHQLVFSICLIHSFRQILYTPKYSTRHARKHRSRDIRKHTRKLLFGSPRSCSFISYIVLLQWYARIQGNVAVCNFLDNIVDKV